MKKVMNCMALAAVLTGCSSAPAIDTQPIYDRHVAAFSLAQPHTTRTLVRKDGYSIHAREFSPALKGGKPTLVMMHGFPDNQHLYDLLAPKLTEHYHVVTFDFLGWGASDKPTEHLYDVASQRADLETVIQQMGLQSVVLVLHDLSGQSGIDWALDNEAHTAALVLLNTYYSPMPTLKAPEAIQFYSTPSPLRDLAVWGSKRSGGTFQGGVSSQLGRFFSNPASREAFIPVITNGSRAIRPAFFGSTSVLWAELEARTQNLPRVQRFKKPVHVIFGADDPYLNVGVANEFKRLFSKASLHLVANAGHYVQLDDADEVGRIIMTQLGLH